jgi:hypothetical protein
MVRHLLTNWLAGLPEAGLIWGEPRTAPEHSRANQVFVERPSLLAPQAPISKRAI